MRRWRDFQRVPSWPWWDTRPGCTCCRPPVPSAIQPSVLRLGHLPLLRSYAVVIANIRPGLADCQPAEDYRLAPGMGCKSCRYAHLPTSRLISPIMEAHGFHGVATGLIAYSGSSAVGPGGILYSFRIKSLVFTTKAQRSQGFNIIGFSLCSRRLCGWLRSKLCKLLEYKSWKGGEKTPVLF
jgi:hypothetical protein